MKKISDPDRRRAYIQEYHLQDYMDLDLMELSELCLFEKNEYLIHAGEISDYLYFMVEGQVMVFSYTSDAKNTCINYLRESSLIGESGSLWQHPPTASVRALTPCVCVIISLPRYRKALLNDIRFLQNVGLILSYRLNNEIHVTNSLMEPMELRLARFILEHTNEQNLFSFQLTTCALILNTSYRHLLRTIRGFCESGLIKKTHGGYLIPDRSRLEEYLNQQST